MPAQSPYFNAKDKGNSRNKPASSRSSRASSNARSAAAAKNTSILSFFKKTDRPPGSDQARITQFISRHRQGNDSDSKQPEVVDTSGGLFFDDDISKERVKEEDNDSLFEGSQPALSQQPYSQQGLQDEDRYHENGLPHKRRRLSAEERDSSEGVSKPANVTMAEVNRRRIGPFVDESEDEDGEEACNVPTPGAADTKDGPFFEEPVLPIKDADNDENDGTAFESPLPVENEATCPICEVTLGGMTELEASSHVNHCLDAGVNPALPEVGETSGAPSDSEASLKADESPVAAAPEKGRSKSGQQSPLAIEATTKSASVFSHMMSENSEATAWAAAAAKEVAARGKRASERQCPFYKILPNFSICVDAFRYGAVEGCEAYFLSHFHSDHYIGLHKNWCHGPIFCSKVTANLVVQQLGVNRKWVKPLPFDETVEVPHTGGAKVTMITANHCPGSSIFLFEKEVKGRTQRILHCGDFRAHPLHVLHPKLAPDIVDPATGKTKLQRIDAVYLDTTYLNPKYGFPNQEDVIEACQEVCLKLDRGEPLDSSVTAAARSMSNFVSRKESKLEDASVVPTLGSNSSMSAAGNANGSRLLVVMGTYSIGKERICLGIARALNSKIYASDYKKRLIQCLEDEDLISRLTSDPREAQVHMHSLMEIRPDTLSDYLTELKPHFTRVVGFRPTGWTYRPPKGRMTENPEVNKVLYSDNWNTALSFKDIKPQRGSTDESACFGIPYSEHSSFRELTMFCCALRIGRIVPTVNVSNATSREKMKKWFERWEWEKRRNGLFKVKEGTTRW